MWRCRRSRSLRSRSVSAVPVAKASTSQVCGLFDSRNDLSVIKIDRLGRTRMAAGRGATLLPLGIVAIVVAFLYMPRCANIPQFSILCLNSWLSVMATLTVLGGAGIVFGVHSLLKARVPLTEG